MKVLLRTDNDFYAQLLKTKLKDAGIYAEIFDENTIFSVGPTMASGGFRVAVDDEDFEKAQKIIEENPDKE